MSKLFSLLQPLCALSERERVIETASRLLLPLAMANGTLQSAVLCKCSRARGLPMCLLFFFSKGLLGCYLQGPRFREKDSQNPKCEISTSHLRNLHLSCTSAILQDFVSLLLQRKEERLIGEGLANVGTQLLEFCCNLAPHHPGTSCAHDLQQAPAALCDLALLHHFVKGLGRLCRHLPIIQGQGLLILDLRLRDNS